MVRENASLKESVASLERQIKSLTTEFEEKFQKAQAQHEKQTVDLSFAVERSTSQVQTLQDDYKKVLNENQQLLEKLGEHERRQEILREMEAKKASVASKEDSKVQTALKTAKVIALEARRKEQAEENRRMTEETRKARDKAEEEVRNNNLKQLKEAGDDRCIVSFKDLYLIRVWVDYATKIAPDSRARNVVVDLEVGQWEKQTSIAFNTTAPTWGEYFSLMADKAPTLIKFTLREHTEDKNNKPPILGEGTLNVASMFAQESFVFDDDIKLYQGDSGPSLRVRLTARMVPQVSMRWPGGYTYMEDISNTLKYANAYLDGVESNAKTALMNASARGQVFAIKTLIAARADVELAEKTAGLTALHIAAINGQLEAIKTLLEGEAFIEAEDNQFRTPLILAAKMGQSAAISLLIERKANLEARDSEGLTPVITAAVSGNSDAIRILAAAKADIEARNSQGATALILAVVNGHADAVATLIDAGADKNVRDPNNLTPLMIAASYNKVAPAEVLVERKADMDAEDNNKRTALMYAAAVGSYGMVVLLASKGCNMMKKDKEDRNAVRIAKDNGKMNIVPTLKEWIKKTNAEVKQKE